MEKEIRELERKITLHHAKVVQEFNLDQDNCLVGFHGQTIYHNPEERISLQLGDGKLLNQLTQKKNNFLILEKTIFKMVERERL